MAGVGVFFCTITCDMGDWVWGAVLLLPGIVFTSESGKDFQQEWGLPILDTVWRLEEEEGRCKQIRYRFFKKPLSSKWVTPYESAQPINGKIASLSQDTFRILSNSSQNATKGEKVEMLETFCERLRYSGYPVRIAARIVRNGILNYENRVERERRGIQYLHRPEDEGKNARRGAKLNGKTNWYRKPRKNGDV